MSSVFMVRFGFGSCAVVSAFITGDWQFHEASGCETSPVVKRDQISDAGGAEAPSLSIPM